MPVFFRVLSIVVFVCTLTACGQSLYVAPAGAANANQSLYVADNKTSSIDVFSLAANGNVAPTFSFGSPSTLAAPLHLVFDRSGKLYVANDVLTASGYSSTVVIFKPPFSASSTPASTLTYSGFNSADGANYIAGLATDPSGNLYVLEFVNSTSPNPDYEVFVFPPGASGNASPTRTITSSVPDQGATISIAVDASTIYLGLSLAGAVFEFPIGSNGAVTPTVLYGGTTGLNLPSAVKIDSLDRLVVRNAGYSGATVLRFAPGATGDVAPLSTIDASFLSNEDVALCLDSAGDFFLNGADPNTAASEFDFFPVSDTDIVSPTRVIDGAMTGLENPTDCAVR